MIKFYKHFATCYGTFWIIIMTAAIIGQTHINAGMFGLIGFPIISALYAFYKVSTNDQEAILLNKISMLEANIYDLEGEIEEMLDAGEAVTD